MSAEVHDLAYAEVMKFNKTNEKREQTNDRSVKNINIVEVVNTIIMSDE